MALSDITDPQAVLRAIEEFDRLGRREFLRTYEYGPVRQYILVHDGREYDSKAIIWVAHKYQFPELGALRRSALRGGETSAVPALRRLGFTHFRDRGLDGAEPPAAARYWALVANPRIYRVDGALPSGTRHSWPSKGRPMKQGDGVVLWRTAGKDGRRGIIAVGEVVGEPELRSDEQDEFWNEHEVAARVEPHVPVRFVFAPGLPLLLDGPHAALLESLSVVRARGGTVFNLTPEQWEAILALARVPATPADDIELIVRPLSRGGGQGRSLSAPERRAVELRAMELAKAHFTRDGYTVEDVAAHRPYDLECTRDAEVLKVEVKGTTGAGASVTLTANEVAIARDYYPHVALFVVSSIELVRRGEAEASATGGLCSALEPWNVDGSPMRALTYEWMLPTPASPAP